MERTKSRSVGRPRKVIEPQEDDDLDDLKYEEAQDAAEPGSSKFKQGAQWSGLVDLDAMRGRTVAPGSI